MLNPASPLPLYHQLAEHLIAQIHRGALSPGDRLPSEPEMSRAYGIGRPTVRQATEVLVRRGLAERRRGAGTFIRATPNSVDLFTMSGTVSSFRSGGHELVTELLIEPKHLATNDVVPKPPLRGASLVYFRRLGRVNERPVLVEDVYLDEEVFEGIANAPLKDMPLSEIVRQRYRLEPIDGGQSFQVTRGPDSVAHALALPDDQHLLLIQRVLDFPNAEAALYSRLYCRTDYVTFSQRLGASHHDRFPSR